MPRPIPLLYLLAVSLLAQGPVTLDDPSKLKPNNVEIQTGAFEGQSALQVKDASVNAQEGVEDRLVVIPGVTFKNGTIELELAGEPGPGAAGQARGFTGIAFRVAPDLSKYECFYLRPTNGRADDQVRRNHSAQYISFPDFPWFRLRKENPEKYESYVDLAPAE